MFITVHAAAATIIGKHITSAPLAFALGIVSHFLLDIIPHGDDEIEKRFFGLKIKRFREEERVKFMAIYASLDAVFMAFFLIFLFKTFDFANTDSVAYAIIGGVLPDFIVFFYKLTDSGWLKWTFDFHTRVHRLATKRMKHNITPKQGLLVQTVLMIILIWLIWIF